jgi:choline-glycine betaine transporter
MGLAAVALLLVGDGGIQALQSFIVVTAVPVGLIMLPTLWTTPRLLRDMAVEQGIVVPPTPPAGEETAADEAGSTTPLVAGPKR